MEDLQISWGETWPFVITTSATNAETATLTIAKVGGDFVYSKSATFVDDGADVSYNPEETELELGDYYYQLRIDYTTGQNDKFPDKKICGTCTYDEDEGFHFPTLTITEALDMPGVS